MSLPKELSEIVEPEESHRLRSEELAKLDYRIHRNTNLNPEDYGIGMIGVGRIANQRQIPAYLNAGLKIVAVADVKEESMEGTKERWNIKKGFLDYHKLLELDEVKIVDVLTNTFPRKQIILDAIKAGKHVISEKPFARSYKDALEMVEAAEKAGVKLAVHQPTRQYYPFAFAKVLIENGYIGEPYFIEGVMHGNQDTVYYESPVTRWHASLDDHLHVEWGAHHFDLLCFLSGKTPSCVYCQGTRMPGQNFKSLMANVYAVEFPGVLRAALILNQVIQSDASDWYYRVEGTLGTIKILSAVTQIEVHSRKSGGTCQFLWNWAESVTGINGLVGGHGAHMVDLVNAIYENREPISRGRDNLNTVRTYLAAKRSAEEGRPVSPDEIKD